MTQNNATPPAASSASASASVGDAEPDSPSLSQGLTLDLDMRDARWQALEGDLRQQAAFIWARLDPKAAMPEAEACLVLADDGELAQMNESFRHKAGPTNVLSFPALDFAAPVQSAQDLSGLPFALLGDIVMSYDRLQAEAQAQGKTERAHALHLLTHGLLHLLGYDHENEADANLMEGLESELLLAAGLANPYDELPQSETEQ
jgi:probable rRNA maturation factor